MATFHQDVQDPNDLVHILSQLLNQVIIDKAYDLYSVTNSFYYSPLKGKIFIKQKDNTLTRIDTVMGKTYK